MGLQHHDWVAKHSKQLKYETKHSCDLVSCDLVSCKTLSAVIIEPTQAFMRYNNETIST